jgi:16S rRNA (guanine966-N2)-methyltransferase
MMTSVYSCSPRRRRVFIVVAAVSLASSILDHSSLCVDAYSFVSFRLRNNHCRHDQQSRTSHTSSSSSSSVRRSLLVMKRPKLSSAQIQLPADESGELPANLKRLVRAARPTLGHVVPKNSKTRQYKPTSTTSAEGGSNTALLRPQGQSRDAGRYNNPSNLRVLGGTVRGFKLQSPNVYLRPMMGKVKEAVYSTFTSFGLYEEGRKTRQLDVFSGSGSVGLESLSRGAFHCTFVDMSEDCCGTCKRNVIKCGFDGWNEGGIGSGIIDDRGEPVALVVCADAFRALRQPETVGIPTGSTYDIVTLCPPYEEIVYADLLDAVANSPLVKEDTVVLVEYPVELGCLPHVIRREDGGILVGVRNRRYGRTVIAMYVVNPTGQLEGAESKPEEFISI